MSPDRRVHRVVVVAVLSLVGAGVGCHGNAPSAPDAAVAVKDAAAEAQVAQVVDAGPAAPPVRSVTRLPPIGQQVALLQILVSDKDVHQPWVPARARNRTPQEAEKIARRLSQEARHGGDFVKLAKEWSDWPFAAQNGGKLGVLVEGAGTAPELTARGLKLEVGEVSDPIATPLGYAVIKRMPLVRASHIVIGYNGIAGTRQTRNHAEAEELANRVHEEIVSGKISFADAAFTYSDELVSAGRGGDIGGFEADSPTLPQVLKRAVLMKKGEVTPPFDSPLGFEILKRTE